VKLGKEEAEDFNKTFLLNWTYRNEFAKTVVTLSSGILALLAGLASSALLKHVPPWIILLDMILLILTIALNVASLWVIIEVTRVTENSMEQEYPGIPVKQQTSWQSMDSQMKRKGGSIPSSLQHVNGTTLWETWIWATRYSGISMPFAEMWHCGKT
jgi:hypothetical protein